MMIKNTLMDQQLCAIQKFTSCLNKHVCQHNKNIKISDEENMKVPTSMDNVLMTRSERGPLKNHINLSGFSGQGHLLFSSSALFVSLFTSYHNITQR